MFYDDTITAISTPYGSGGIGIVRISGEKSFDIADKIFKGKKKLDQVKSHTITYGKIIDNKDGSAIDEVLLTKMEGPKTYTREDVIEINCHGGIVVLKKVLELVIRNGARLAEPGEFTKRAFLNGRIDLTQAEAVIDLINAKTTLSSKIALSQLEGVLSKKIKDAKDALVELLAHIESTLDFPEEDFDKITEQVIREKIEKIKAELFDILSTFDKGKILKEGVNAVIVGKPNVGKSSLLNRLTGYDRAIVTDVPGTTRDTIEEYINVEGIPLKIIDTAGIRETGDIIEKIGVDKAKKAIDSADLIIMMIDAVEGFTNADAYVLKSITEKKKVLLINKIDLLENLLDCQNINKIYQDTKLSNNIELKDSPIILSSMKDGRGLDDLRKEIAKLFWGGEIKEHGIENVMTNVRHKTLMENALNSLDDAILAYSSGMPMDCIAIDIRNAALYLGSITGENISDEILDEIFSTFCIGK